MMLNKQKPSVCALNVNEHNAVIIQNIGLNQIKYYKKYKTQTGNNARNGLTTAVCNMLHNTNSYVLYKNA